MVTTVQQNVTGKPSARGEEQGGGTECPGNSTDKPLQSFRVTGSRGVTVVTGDRGTKEAAFGMEGLCVSSDLAFGCKLRKFQFKLD